MVLFEPIQLDTCIEMELISLGTVKKILRQIEKDKGIRVDEVKIEFPITSNESVSQSLSFFSAHKQSHFATLACETY